MNVAILIIDGSNEITQNLKSTILSSYPAADIEHIDNSVEAYGMCCVSKYDLIFCDYEVPQLNGLKAGQFLKTGEDSLNEQTPIVLVSPCVTELQAADAFACSIIEKSIETEKMVTLMKQLIGDKLVD